MSLPGLVATAPSAWDKAKGFIQQHLEFIFAFIILFSIAVYLWRQNTRFRLAEREKADGVRKTAERLATTVATEAVGDPLSNARQRFESGDYTGFYRELNRAVWKAITDQLDIPASDLNKYNIARRLEARGWDAQATRSLEHILNECEMNLYTPAYDMYNMQQLLRQAEDLLRVLVSHSPN